MLIPSKDWHRLGMDPIACRRWYCTSKLHGRKYQAGWLQVVIVARLVQGLWERYYMRARVPDWDENDVRALDAEEGLASSTDSPLDVDHKLQSLNPSADDLVVPAWHAEAGCVRLRSWQDMDAMPWFPWGPLHGMESYEPANDRAEEMAACVF